ncbi:hypothetical protein AF335_31835 [Streptomyces eurocidicus]|uniref:Uncharacterized protein n=1 Tax=Streptomyces eurocidicus TaxID=66423 RepID=A0A2N8NME9_STREU|nr:hypothetical protein [Streptomyces eurocidicus]MBB5120654.1 hypothetical protein [Streptomyces eurocidicus]MBF6054995.1 hypothetical protein [Streptomyces eurocidicus]PNE29946.1 hypothetical protein AF335_31835 [Streptomyces eurocidicus]
MTTTTEWLAQAADDPRAAIALWKENTTAPLVAGRQWDLVRLDFTLATAVISHLKTRGRHIGPYVMGGVEHAMWWLIPLGGARRVRRSPGVAPYRKGAELFVPPPGRYLGERVWVLPDADGERRHTPTSDGALREALGALVTGTAPPR